MVIPPLKCDDTNKGELKSPLATTPETPAKT